MAEATITKILLRRGVDGDLKTADGDGVVLDIGEPGFTTNTKRLYIGAPGAENVPIPQVDEQTITYNNNGEIGLMNNLTTQLKTSHTGAGCITEGGTIPAAISASEGGIYSKKAIYCSDDVISYCSSDEQLKEDIEIINNPLKKLSQLRGVTFEWNCLQNNYTGRDTGIIAQDVERTELPGIVETRDDGYKAIKYDRLVPLLIESIKQLNDKVDELSKIINDERE
tara:strand:- start:360 stop:1034 length:675 start_codon:yes stop_codon:yes gene_type:complete